MRTNATRERGSVLVLAVGLLTILVMLGAAFLLISDLDAGQADAIADASEIDPVAEGVAGQIRRVLAEEVLYLGDNGPYTADAYTAGSWRDQWRRYRGYPGDDADDASVLHYDDGVTQHLSELGGFDRADPGDVGVPGTPVDTNGDATNDATVTDTNGDGDEDAFVLRTGVYNEDGYEYLVAAKVVNLDGKLCLNTAGPGAPGGASMPPTVRPVNVDLEAYLGATRYNRLHYQGDPADAGRGARWQEAPDLDGDGTADADDFVYYNEYSARFAERLFEPEFTGGYVFYPFGPGEEVFLRWLGPSAVTRTGRVCTLTADPIGSDNVLPASTRRNLAAYNVCRSLLRPTPRAPGTAPDPDWDGETMPRPLPLHALLDLSDSANRQAVYARMYTLLTQLNMNPNVSKRWAAHFVANLWAYQAADATDAPFAFTPNNVETAAPEDFTVFGLVQDVVISEAYAAHKGAPDPANQNWAYAVEVLNPTNGAVNLSGDYHLWVDGEDKDWAGKSISIASGSRVVLYSIRDATNSDELGLPNSFPGHWHEVPHITFKDGETIRLIRNDGNVPVDAVSATDVGYDNDIPDTETVEKWDIRRDDDAARYRYNIAAYASSTDNQWLGATNNVGPNGLDDNDHNLYPVWIARTQQPLRTLGEFGRIYMSGPYRQGTGAATVFSAFPQHIQDGTFKMIFPDAPGRARLTLGAQGTWGQGQNYPSVPMTCLAAEFFSLVPTDTTRADDPRRIYGRVNLNTAPPAVLAHLPWPDSITVGGTAYNIADPSSSPATFNELAAFIVAYRDLRHPRDYVASLNNSVVNTYFDYSAQTRSNISGLQQLRTAPANYAGFVSRGEIAVPLADYVRYRIRRAGDDPDTVERTAGYANARDTLVRVAADLVAIRGEAFAATIRLYAPRQGGGYDSRYYLAEYDTSNCNSPGDLPLLLVFTRLQ